LRLKLAEKQEQWGWSYFTRFL